LLHPFAATLVDFLLRQLAEQLSILLLFTATRLHFFAGQRARHFGEAADAIVATVNAASSGSDFVITFINSPPVRSLPHPKPWSHIQGQTVVCRTPELKLNGTQAQGVCDH